MTSSWNDAENNGTRIKICGLRDIGMIEVAIEAGADAVGFVLAQGSPRTVSIEDALAMSSDLPPSVIPIGVVVDDDPALHAKWSPRWIQFHGQEEEAVIADYEGPVIRGFSFSLEAVDRWDHCDHVDRLLVDADGRRLLHGWLPFRWGALLGELRDALLGVAPCAFDVPGDLGGGPGFEGLGEGSRDPSGSPLKDLGKGPRTLREGL